MQLFKRSGTLISGGVAASFLLFGCQSTKDGLVDSPEVAPIATEPVDLVSEVPSEDDIVKSKDAELRELEEALLEQAKPRAEEARSLEEQADRYGIEIVRLDETKHWKLSKGGRVLLLKEESRVAVLDGVKVFLDTPLKRVRGKWLLGASDERVLLDAVFGVRSTDRASVATIVLDPGHGGTEDGTKNEALGVLEKDMNLDVSLRLKGHLEKLGFKVVMTRYDDRLVELAKRPEISNGVKADLFLSVHFNAALNEKANGLETYMLTPAGHASSSGAVAGKDAIAYPGNRYDVDNFELAFRIQKSLLDRLEREDRGVKKARFKVLKTLDCPGVLAECGFVSNANEGLLISTAGYRERVAQALAEAIVAYAGNPSDADS
ncbi:N-acetylmuramoyl-L-alanine amidase domain protein [Verrucomicrobiia bacterium DG1235]|nr:N-acetylmuramoyl-L-alanine amidase domain protein [Verrucomicrobiae bacterium DG1235]